MNENTIQETTSNTNTIKMQNLKTGILDQEPKDFLRMPRLRVS